jgi:predicted secreted protein
MATTSVINTTALAFYVYDAGSYKKVGRSTGGTLTISHATRDITSKDSAGWRELLEGLRSWNISGSGLLAFDDTFAGEQLDSSTRNRTELTVRFMTGVSGDTFWQGTGYLTEFTADSPGQEENVTYSYTLEGNGTITKGTIT